MHVSLNKKHYLTAFLLKLRQAAFNTRASLNPVLYMSQHLFKNLKNMAPLCAGADSAAGKITAIFLKCGAHADVY